MSEKPFFSVVIPTYNRASFIERAVRSVVDQANGDFEIIVVDDGSTDDTAHRLSYIKDNRLRYLKRENGERAAARNFGIKSARGRYITFLDSDDFLKPSYLQAAYDYIGKNPEVTFLHLGYDVVLPGGGVLHQWKPLPDPANEKLVEGNFLSCLGIFIKREILLNNLFNEDRNLSGSEDYELWIRLAAKFPVRTLPISAACLVNHERRSVLSIDTEKLEERIALTKKYLRADQEVNNKFKHKLKMLFAYLDLYTALHVAMAKEKRKGWRILYNAINASPIIIFNYRAWVVIKKLILH
jgi:glycosyltransferase involved in cell wall biosynthesis